MDKFPTLFDMDRGLGKCVFVEHDEVRRLGRPLGIEEEKGDGTFCVPSGRDRGFVIGGAQEAKGFLASKPFHKGTNDQTVEVFYGPNLLFNICLVASLIGASRCTQTKSWR